MMFFLSDHLCEQLHSFRGIAVLQASTYKTFNVALKKTYHERLCGEQVECKKVIVHFSQLLAVWREKRLMEFKELNLV